VKGQPSPKASPISGPIEIGPSDPIEVQKSDSPRERAIFVNWLPQIVLACSTYVYSKIQQTHTVLLILGLCFALDERSQESEVRIKRPAAISPGVRA